MENNYSLRHIKESSQRVPQVGLYPDCADLVLDDIDSGSMQGQHKGTFPKSGLDKISKLQNPRADSGVGLDSGFDSLYQSSGYLPTELSSGSSSRIPESNTTSTDLLEKHIQQLNIDDQHDSLLRDNSVSLSCASDAYISGPGPSLNNSLSLTSKEEEKQKEVLRAIKDDITFPSPQQYWDDAFTADEDGDTKLHIAIIQGAPEVYNIMSLSTSHQCVNISNELFYQTPLHLAVLTAQWNVARQLMVWGALVALQDHNGDTPLHIACRQGDMNCVRVLTSPVTYEEVTNIHYSIPFQKIPQDTIFNYKGETCLHIAANNRHLDIVRYLVEMCGADMNAQDHTAGRTVLHSAVAAGDLTLVQLLVSLHRHGLDIEAENFAHRTALQLAVDNDLDEISESLIKAGANQDNVEIDGSLDLAMDESDEELPGPLEYDDLSIYGQPITFDPDMFTNHLH